MEKIYEVCWDGPYTKDTLDEISEEDNNKYVLYKVYGSHPVYGNNVLLYIGMTGRGIKKRLVEHDYWMDEERFGPSKIYVASIGEFSDWESSNKIDIFNSPSREIIEQVESLLIYSHQPVHNSKSRDSAKNAKEIRIFNTGKYGHLMPEVSGLFQAC